MMRSKGRTRRKAYLAALAVVLVAFFASQFAVWNQTDPVRRPAPVATVNPEPPQPDRKSSNSLPTGEPVLLGADSPEPGSSLKYPVISEEQDSRTIVFAATHAMVRFGQQPGRALREALHEMGFAIGERLHGNTYLVNWESTRPEREFRERIDLLKTLPGVEHLERDHLVTSHQSVPDTPADWLYGIDMDYLQTQQRRADGVVVALLDTGVNSTHEDIGGLLYRNASESLNGLDDDGNGYVDDVYGYDFVRLDRFPEDEDGHGTALAGAIGAVRGNDRGIDGIAEGVKILNVRILDEEGIGFLSDAVKGVRYASDFDIDLMNCSWGTLAYSEELFLAFQEFTNDGGLVVAAAGNSRTDIASPSSAQYPACFELENLISIGSHGRSGEISPFSNYAFNHVDWLLPGEALYLPFLGDESYAAVSGTSVSAAIMSGVMALARNRFPDSTWPEILEKAKRSTPPHEPFYVNDSEFSHLAQYYGLLDVARLLEQDFVTLPDISISINPDSYLFGDTVTLTAVGIDGMPGERSWFDRLEANVLENHTDVITLKASYTNRNWDIYFRFGGYYGHKTIGPIRLSPGELNLRLTNGFEFTHEVAGESLEIRAAVEGSGPISVAWYSAGTGYEVAKGPSLQVSSDYLGLDKSYYFVAENSLNRIQSPVFSVQDRGDLEMRAIPFKGLLSEDNPFSNWHSTPLEDVVYGNGIYLGLNWIHFQCENYISSDGINWHHLSRFNDIDLTKLGFFKDHFFGLADSQLYKSADGLKWTTCVDDPVLDFRVADQYLVVRDKEGAHWKSRDGNSWSESDPIWFAGGLYYRTREGSPIQYSTDLVNWEEIHQEGPNPFPESIDDLQYTEGLWLMRSGDWSMASRDGKTWSQTFALGNIRNLIFEAGAYYCGNPSQGTRISSDLELTSRYASYGGGFLKRLENGRLIGSIANNGEASILVQETDRTREQPFLAWEVDTHTDLVLGDPLPVYFSYPQDQIESLELYIGNVLQETRHAPPYYQDYYPSLVGHFEVLAILKLRDGSTRFSESRAVSVRMPQTELQIQENRIFGQPAILGNGEELGMVYQAGKDGMRTLVLVPDIDDMDSKIQIGDPIPFVSGRDHAIFRSPDGNRVIVLTNEPDGLRKYLEIHADGTMENLATFTFDEADLFVEYWDPDLISYNPYPAEGSPVTLLGRDGSQVPLWTLPNSYRPYKDPDEGWQIIETRFNDRRYGEDFISALDPSFVWNPAENQQWELPYRPDYEGTEYSVNGYLEDWLAVRVFWERGNYSQNGKQYLVHTDGRVHPFDLGEDFFGMLDFVDRSGNYVAYLGSDERLFLLPRNEIALLADPLHPEPRAVTKAEGLFLDIPLSIRQLSLGPGREMDLSLEVYLSTDPEPDFDDAAYLGGEVFSNSFERGNGILTSVSVPLPAEMMPGSYSIGVLANPEGMDFSERTHNNSVWFQWTIEADTKQTISQNPEIGTIFLNPDNEALAFGEEVSIRFEPRPGFRFTGWGGDLDGRENPAVRLLPNELSVSAGALPDDLASLFPDARYSGINLWHESNSFGWFESHFYPWLYHLNHGWIYLQIDPSGNRVHYLDPELGWIYTEGLLYPYLYQHATGNWLYYLKDSRHPRWFYDLGSSRWISSGR